MARPTKYDAAKGEEICNRLRAGSSRKAAAESVGVWYTTMLDWLKRGKKAKEGDEFHAFYHSATRAEAECELRNTTIVEKAAFGHDTVEKHRTVKTVFRTRKITQLDGTKIEEPVALEEVGEVTITKHEYDWKAALEWLKRRRRLDWGDSLDITKLPTESLIALLEGNDSERT